MPVSTTLRGLRRTPWFAATAIFTVALGIGATASIFSVVNRVLLAPLPYRDPDRLVWIATWNAERGRYLKALATTSTPGRSARRSSPRSRRTGFTYRSPAPIIRKGWPVGSFAPGLFATLGAPAAMGRTFGPEDGEAGRDNVVVLSDRLWRRRFDARADVVGTTVELDGRSYVMAGGHATDVHASVSPGATVDARSAVDPGARRPQAAVLQGHGPAARRCDPGTGRDGASRHRRAAGP